MFKQIGPQRKKRREEKEATKKKTALISPRCRQLAQATVATGTPSMLEKIPRDRHHNMHAGPWKNPRQQASADMHTYTPRSHSTPPGPQGRVKDESRNRRHVYSRTSLGKVRGSSCRNLLRLPWAVLLLRPLLVQVRLARPPAEEAEAIKAYLLYPPAGVITICL